MWNDEPSDKLSNFARNLTRLQEGGFVPSSGLIALLARWSRVRNAPGTGNAFDALIQAVIRGEEKGAPSIDDLLVDSVIQSLVEPFQVGRLVEQSAQPIWAEVRRLWDCEVDKAIAFFGDKLANAGASLASALALVDPDMPAEQVVMLDEGARIAWGTMSLYAHEVAKAHDLYVIAVRTATKLEGEDVYLAVVDFAESDLPEAWEALDRESGRGGNGPAFFSRAPRLPPACRWKNSPSD